MDPRPHYGGIRPAEDEPRFNPSRADLAQGADHETQVGLHLLGPAGLAAGTYTPTTSSLCAYCV